MLFYPKKRQKQTKHELVFQQFLVPIHSWRWKSLRTEKQLSNSVKQLDVGVFFCICLGLFSDSDRLICSWHTGGIFMTAGWCVWDWLKINSNETTHQHWSSVLKRNKLYYTSTRTILISTIQSCGGMFSKFTNSVLWKQKGLSECVFMYLYSCIYRNVEEADNIEGRWQPADLTA